jgi:hypothetical protein
MATSYKRTAFKCDICAKDTIIRVVALKRKKKINGKLLCFSCWKRRQTMAKTYDAVPIEYHKFLDANLIDFDIAEKYLQDIQSSICVSFECISCNMTKTLRWCKILARKFDAGVKICYSCLQSKINNRDDYLEAHRVRGTEMWKHQEYRKKCIKGFEAHNKKMQLDVEYSQKHRRKSKSVSGEILIGDKFVKFDSGFELIYLAGLDHASIVRRCNFAISYKKRYYHPDFMVISNGRKTIVEIKGFYKNAVEEKQEAAIAYIAKTKIADNYILYDTDRLLREGILIGTGGGHFWRQIRKINNERIVRFSDVKHQQIAATGKNKNSKIEKNKQDSIQRQSI